MSIIQHCAVAWHRVFRSCGALVLMLAFHLSAQAIETPRTAGCDRGELGGRHFEFAKLPRGSDSLDFALGAKFEPAPGNSMNFGMVGGSVWLRFELGPGPCGKARLLQLGNPFVNRIELYRQAQGGSWALVPALEHPLDTGGETRLRFVMLSLDVDPEQPVSYLARIGGPSAVLVAPKIVSRAELHASAVDRMRLGGLFTGGIVALALYCAFLGVMTRFKGLIAFSASALALGGFYSASTGMLDGLASSIAGSGQDPRDFVMRMNGVFILFASLAHWFFVRGLLETSDPPQASRRWAPVLLGIWGGALVGVLFVDGTSMPVMYIGTSLLAVFAVSYQVLRAALLGHPLAKVMIVAFGALAVSIVLYIALFVGLLAWHPALVHSLAIGTWIESILLAVAIGTHVKDLRGQQRQLAARTQELSLLSQIDPLTGLSNRRAYDAVVPVEIERCQRRGRTASLLVVDIDHFKQVNDNYGHSFGDSVIRMLGATIANSVRSTDYAYRYGGEEFVVLLPGLDRSMALEVAERIMREFTNCSPSAPDGTRPFFSVSIGLAQLRRDDNPARLFSRADSAMYRAKQEGRCRTVVDDEASGPEPASAPHSPPVASPVAQGAQARRSGANA